MRNIRMYEAFAPLLTVKNYLDNQYHTPSRKLPNDYCPKCEIKMSRASKHKYVCPNCRKTISFKP